MTGGVAGPPEPTGSGRLTYTPSSPEVLYGIQDAVRASRLGAITEPDGLGAVVRSATGKIWVQVDAGRWRVAGGKRKTVPLEWACIPQAALLLSAGIPIGDLSDLGGRLTDTTDPLPSDEQTMAVVDVLRSSTLVWSSLHDEAPTDYEYAELAGEILRAQLAARRTEAERDHVCEGPNGFCLRCNDNFPEPARGRTEAETKAAAALMHILGIGCETYTRGSCIEDGGRTRDAEYSADRWCDACVAADALGVDSDRAAVAASLLAQPETPEQP